MELSLSDRRVWLGILFFALVLGVADAHGYKLGIFLAVGAVYFFQKHWDTGKNYIFYILIVGAVAAPILRYNDVQDQKKQLAQQLADDRKIAAESADFKRNLPAGTCEDLRKNPRSMKMVEQMCYRMYPSSSFGDSAARSVCVSEEYKAMKACGVEYLPTIY